MKATKVIVKEVVNNALGDVYREYGVVEGLELTEFMIDDKYIMFKHGNNSFAIEHDHDTVKLEVINE